jgi:hypothetical protein
VIRTRLHRERKKANRVCTVAWPCTFDVSPRIAVVVKVSVRSNLYVLQLPRKCKRRRTPLGTRVAPCNLRKAMPLLLLLPLLLLP